MSHYPSLKIRVDVDTGLGGPTCDMVARRIIDAANAVSGLPPIKLLDAKWATPADEWRERGGGW